MEKLKFYPKTSHLWGSKEKSSLLVQDAEKFDFLIGQYCVFEEKVDGQSIGIFFKEGLLHLLFRGQYFCPEKNIAVPYELRNCYEDLAAKDAELYSILGESHIMYGEWLEYTHSVKYNNLPSYFIEYDIYNMDEDKFLSTLERKNFLQPVRNDISSIATYFEGVIESGLQVVDILNKNKVSHYRTGEDLLPEGFYVKIEEDEVVMQRFKWIEPDFFNKVINSPHWRENKKSLNEIKQLNNYSKQIKILKK